VSGQHTKGQSRPATGTCYVDYRRLIRRQMARRITVPSGAHNKNANTHTQTNGATKAALIAARIGEGP